MKEGTKMKQQEAIAILQNNSNGVLSASYNQAPYNFPVCYDTDCFCGCLKIYIRVKRCSELAQIVENNGNVSLIVASNNASQNNYSWGFNCNNNNYGDYSIIANGTAVLEEDEQDCCCPQDQCYCNLVITVANICGRDNIKCPFANNN